MERRFISLPDSTVKLEERAAGKTPLLVGYAARWYDPSESGTEYRFNMFGMNVRERIMPSAFDAALREDEIVGLFNHDPNYVLGRSSAGTMRLVSDSKGLRYEIDPPASASGIIEAIQRGDVHGSSFSFSIRSDGEKWSDDTDGHTAIRELTNVRLYDVGPVTFAAYSASSTGVRAASDLEEVRASYQSWKKVADDRAAFHRDLTRTTVRVIEIENNC